MTTMICISWWSVCSVCTKVIICGWMDDDDDDAIITMVPEKLDRREIRRSQF